jgi:hypothetical protein
MIHPFRFAITGPDMEHIRSSQNNPESPDDPSSLDRAELYKI